MIRAIGNMVNKTILFFLALDKTCLFKKIIGINVKPKITRKENFGTLNPSDIHQGAIEIVTTVRPIRKIYFSSSKIAFLLILILFIY
jgi:hypothetical protein